MLPHAGALPADQQPMLASSSHGSSSSTAAAAPVVAQRMQNTRCFGRQLEGAMLSCFWPQGCCRAGAQQAAGTWWGSGSKAALQDTGGQAAAEVVVYKSCCRGTASASWHLGAGQQISSWSSSSGLTHPLAAAAENSAERMPCRQHQQQAEAAAGANAARAGTYAGGQQL